MNTALEQSGIFVRARPSELFGWATKVLKQIFGCRHPHLSLPFTRGKETYRTCIACGARRRFDPENWTMVGPYYYPERDLPSVYADRR
jgi:hypothetical protein